VIHLTPEQRRTIREYLGKPDLDAAEIEDLIKVRRIGPDYWVRCGDRRGCSPLSTQQALNQMVTDMEEE
jgi:hypothetical protein